MGCVAGGDYAFLIRESRGLTLGPAEGEEPQMKYRDLGEPSFPTISGPDVQNRAAALMDLPPGLEEKIRVCNATYTVRFGVRLRGGISDLHRLSLGPFRTHRAREGRYPLRAQRKPGTRSRPWPR